MASTPPVRGLETVDRRGRDASVLAREWDDNVLPLRSLPRPAGAPRPAGTLLFTTGPLVTVMVGGSSWMIAPQRALWVPHGSAFEAGERHSSSCHALAVSPGEPIDLPADVCLVEAGALLRELLVEAERLVRASSPSPRRQWIMSLIASAIVETPLEVSAIIAPSDARLQHICNAILADPSDNRTIDEWARIVGMSRRALTRQFRAETRMSFAVWRQQVRLQQALARLRMGESVTRVAYEVGYESVSTFSTIFRQNFGASPSSYAKGIA